jgi:hypothetical protein
MAKQHSFTHSAFPTDSVSPHICSVNNQNIILPSYHTTLIIMHDTLIDHTRVWMWKFMNSVWHRKWVVWHINKWSYFCSISLLTYRTGFRGNLKSLPPPSLWRAVHPKALQYRKLPSITNCISFVHMKYTFACGIIRITKLSVTFNTYARNLTSTTELKTTHTLSHDHLTFIRIAIYVHIYLMKSVNKKTL